MTDAADDPDAGTMFDRYFAQHAVGLGLAVEEDAHRPFLTNLFVACSPLRGVLPDAVVLHQAAMRETAYRADYPKAMRRIVLTDGAPVGRIMVDWTSADGALLVDIAVLPDARATGAGRAMLHAYLAVADHRRQRGILQVQRDNPARRLYAGLGFVEVETDEFAPFVDMVRAPGSRSG